MARIPQAVAVLLTLALPGISEADPPKFRDYPVDIYGGRAVGVRLETDEARQHRANLVAAARGKPNFAGRYILTTWECGFRCVRGAVVDATSGKVLFLPFSIADWGDSGQPVYFKASSRLIVFEGRLDDAGDGGAHFFLFDGEQFKPLDAPSETEAEIDTPQGRSGGIDLDKEPVNRIDRDTFRFSICNRSRSDASVAVVARADLGSKDFAVQGWWTVKRKDCIAVGDFPKGDFLYAAIAGSGTGRWGNGPAFCVQNEVFKQIVLPHQKCDPRLRLKFDQLFVTDETVDLTLRDTKPKSR